MCPLLRTNDKGPFFIGIHQRIWVSSDDNLNFLPKPSKLIWGGSFGGRLLLEDPLYHSSDEIQKQGHLFFQKPHSLEEEV